MSRAPYWQDRFLRIEEERESFDISYIQDMQERYQELSDLLEKQIERWLNRFSTKEGIDPKEAKRLLSKKEQAAWRLDLIAHKEKAVKGGYDDLIPANYYRYKITQLEQLKKQVSFELAHAASREIQIIEPHLMNQFNNSYLKNIYELTDQGAFSIPFTRYNSDMLRQAVYKPWIKSDFSRRVWGHHLDAIPDKLSKTLSQATVNGWGIDRTTKEMMEGIDRNLKNRMTTLVQNESAHLAESASQKAYEQTSVKEYRWLATLEVHTCDQCGNLDNKIFEVGHRDSPLPIEDTHVNCRCTTAPEIPGWSGRSRWYRDPITGKGSRGQYESFEEWKKDHSTPEVELQLKKEKNLTSDKKQYSRYKTLLGKGNLPKTLADFQELKYENPEMYSFVKLDYRRRNYLVNNPSYALPTSGQLNIPEEKFTQYLFNEKSPAGSAKGKAFESRLGYNSSNYKELINAIKTNAAKYPVTKKSVDKYGQRYEQKTIVYGLKEKPANVIIGWIDDGKEIRLTTAIIKEVK